MALSWPRIENISAGKNVQESWIAIEIYSRMRTRKEVGDATGSLMHPSHQ